VAAFSVILSFLEVLQALGRLPAHTQAMMLAYYKDNMTQEEVAERFSATAAAVRMAKSRVMRRLRQEFEDLSDEA